MPAQLRATVKTSSDDIVTTVAYYYGAAVATAAGAGQVFIRDGGSSGTIIDSFELSAAARSEFHMLPQPVKVQSLYCTIANGIQEAVVYFHEES